MGWNEINEAQDRAHKRSLETRDAETRGRFREVELQHAHFERLAKLRCENANSNRASQGRARRLRVFWYSLGRVRAVVFRRRAAWQTVDIVHVQGCRATDEERMAQDPQGSCGRDCGERIMTLKSKPSGVLERVAEQVDRGQKPDIYKAAIERLEEIVTAQAARIKALEDSVAQLEAFKRDNDGINRW